MTIIRSHCVFALIAFVPLVAISASGCNSKAMSDVRSNHQNAQAIRAELEAGVVKSDAAGDTAVVAEPTGWATLSVVFKISGTAPTRVALNADKDKEVCAPGGKTVFSEDLVVGSEGGIKDVVIFVSQKLPPDEPWTHPSAKPGKTDEVVFDQEHCTFLSHVFVSQVSQPMRIKNSDPVGHNTSLKPNANNTYDQTIPAKQSDVYRAAKEEIAPFRVSCAIHPWMKANIMFRNNSYFAVTAPDGKFEIPNLPAGVELEFRVWQEKTIPQAVTVNGEPKKWSKGKFKLKLEPNQPTHLEVVIDSSVFK